MSIEAHAVSVGRRRARALCAAGIMAIFFVFAPPALAKPRLFGTVEFQMDLKKQQNWLSALERNRKNPIFFDEKRFNSSTLWKDLKKKAAGHPLPEKLNIVNKFWNLWPYRTDQEIYGKPDYWAAPYQFLSKSGDCEDYCIVKYFTLKELGVPIDDMRIVVVKETIRNIGHAVLAVYSGDKIYILDNLSEAVRPAERVRNYVPQFSVNEKHRWVHIKAR
ncbi:transglutaminase-like cysteine peptidase [uncultured Mailhella sp.]|uniref:transglutaminase-like cysteine peptidase n=1 Tax=uncultured Mailhella sp. TaxID=1981031 RepID=UPI0025DBD501|nr:transglutaminase-like cysteine peptidase [uncultured Mailhella sp.]